MTEEINIKSIIEQIKRNYNLNAIGRQGICLDQFSIFRKGDNFRIRYSWSIEDNIYLLSIDNSYRIDVVKPGLNWSPRTRVFQYLYGYSELSSNFPDLIIRPKTIADRVADLFNHFCITLEDNDRFNELYVLTSPDKQCAKKVLNNKLVREIVNSYEIFVEIRNSKCLIIYERPATYDDTISLIKVAHELKSILIN